MSVNVTTLAATAEGVFMVLGLVFLWRFGLSPRARATPAPQRLDHWPAPLSEFMILIWLILGGAFIGQASVSLLNRHGTLDQNLYLIVATAMFHLGMLGGIALFHYGLRHPFQPTKPGPVGAVLSGVVTFLIAQPLVTAVSLGWQALLQKCDYPVEPQDAVNVLLHTQSPAMRVLFVAVAAGIAPISEEMVFRAGIFRWMRTRVSRPLAILFSASLFSALHGSFSFFVPLVVLGALFAIAYERTGRIGTTITAHALFNLNSAMLLLAGVTTP